MICNASSRAALSGIACACDRSASRFQGIVGEILSWDLLVTVRKSLGEFVRTRHFKVPHARMSQAIGVRKRKFEGKTGSALNLEAPFSAFLKYISGSKADVNAVFARCHRNLGDRGSSIANSGVDSASGLLTSL